jgi:integrase
MWLGYINYLNDRRHLQVGTLAQHASMIVAVIQYLQATTRHEDRVPEYKRLLTTWRAFRNRLCRQHMAVIRSKDMDTDRAQGRLIPTWQELVMVVGHQLGKASPADGSMPMHEDVQTACVLALFVLLPAMRSGIWRTLQLHQDAAGDSARQRFLDSQKVNYMYYDEQQEAFTLKFNKDHKRNFPVMSHIRRAEVPRVHDVLFEYICHHRRPLLRLTRDRNAGRDYLFFNAQTGHPYDKPFKMALWVSKLVRRAAVELGLYPGRAMSIKCTPHTFRHALYEYIHGANVPLHVKQSVAAACLHSVEVANQYYGKVSHDRQTQVARQYVYQSAIQLLDERDSKTTALPGGTATTSAPQQIRPHARESPIRSSRCVCVHVHMCS